METIGELIELVERRRHAIGYIGGVAERVQGWYADDCNSYMGFGFLMVFSMRFKNIDLTSSITRMIRNSAFLHSQ